MTWFARRGGSEYEEDENGVRFHNRPRPRYLVPTLSQNEGASAPALTDKTLGDRKRISISGWGAATAGIFCIGIVLLSFFPGRDRQSSIGKEKPRVTADAARASRAGSGSGPTAALRPTDLDGVAGSEPAKHETHGDGAPAASDALGRPIGRASDESKGQDVRRLAARENPAATGPANSSPRGTSQAAKGALSAPVKTAAARPKAPAPAPAHVPKAPATLPRPGGTAPAILGATARAGPVRTPARWIGGGPSDADNRGGRYHGTVGVQVTVNRAGYVSRCAPVGGSGNARLGTMTCRLVLQRARFTPALDEQGRPIASQVYTTFVWGRIRRR